jgi:aspartate carbamoyltransferase regulatory subunit
LSIIEHVPQDCLHVLTQITSKKYIIKITLIFSNNFKIDIIALFDTGAYLNCIKEGIIQK